VLTAGEYKRTLTVFGENTEKAGEVQEDLDITHQLFKDFVARYRPQLHIDEVATGEVWLGVRHSTASWSTNCRPATST
jgi:serine protease SohB